MYTKMDRTDGSPTSSRKVKVFRVVVDEPEEVRAFPVYRGRSAGYTGRVASDDDACLSQNDNGICYKYPRPAVSHQISSLPGRKGHPAYSHDGHSKVRQEIWVVLEELGALEEREFLGGPRQMTTDPAAATTIL